MARSKWQLAAFIGGVLLLILAVTYALGAFDLGPRDDAAARAAKRAANPSSNAAYQERRFAKEIVVADRAAERAAAVPEPERRRCDVPQTHTTARLANARIYETHFREGEVNSDDPTTNRVFACLYDTGQRMDLGFNDVVYGSEFMFADGAGDFLAYTTTMWIPADGSADCFFVVNLRTKSRVYGDPGCNKSESGITIYDVAVTTKGSFALSRVGGGTSRAEVVAKPDGEPKTRVVDVFKSYGVGDFRLLKKAGSLEWLDSRSDRQSVVFP